MSSFKDALEKAGIVTDSQGTTSSVGKQAFTLELKLYEMKSHISAMERIYQKYLHAKACDKDDFVDSLANRYGYMVIAFQDIMTTIGKLSGTANKTEEYSIRRAISEFQGLFEQECTDPHFDNAISSFVDRNEIVHVYENYRGNMETVLENVQSYVGEYQKISEILMSYCKEKQILNK